MLCRSKVTSSSALCAVLTTTFDSAPEFDWTLQSEDNKERISSADNLKVKMDDALKESDLHQGF